MPYSSITLPIGYLLCDGSEVSRTEYSTLFEIIGTSYGEGDGTNTFNLPNIKGKVAIGLDSEDEDFSVLGKTGGEKEHKLTVDEMPKHRHTVSLLSSGSGTYKNLYSGIDGTPYATSSSYAGGDIPHNNLQPYTVVNYIIKASGTAVLNGNVVDNLTDNSTENAPSQRAVNEALLDTYSTEEQVIGTWIDGKPIYRKSLFVSGFPTFTSNKHSFNHNIANFGVCLKIYGVLFDTGNQCYFNLPYTGRGTSDIMLYSSSSLIYVEQSPYGNNRLKDFYITIEYTKTTD